MPLRCSIRGPRQALVVSLVAVALSINACGEDSPPKTQLKLNLAPGDTRHLSLAADVAVYWKMTQEPLELKINGHSDCDMKVNSIDDQGNFIVDMTIQRIAYNIAGSSLDHSFDSQQVAEQDKPNSGDDYNRAAIGQPVTLKLDVSGQPIEIIDAKRLTDHMNTKNLHVNDDWIKGQYLDLAKFIMAPLPDHPVSTGDKWQRQRKTDLFQFDATYKLSDFRDRVAHIDLFGTLNIAFGDTTGRIHGQILVDQQTGWLKSQDIDLNVSNSNGTIKVDGTISIKGK